MRQVPNGEFKFPTVASVVFGTGSVQQLKRIVNDFGARRVLVITVAPIATETDLLGRVKDVLGEKCAGVFSGVVQHVPRQCVIEGAKLAKEVGADLLISLGGSSAADAAKGINLVLAEAKQIDSFLTKFNRSDIIKAAQFHQPKLCQIAIPTTLSAGEFTSIVGITDTKRNCKDLFRDVKLTPRVIILDPEMTVFTPRELWVATGLKSLSDGFGRICAPATLPFVLGLAMHATNLINQHLVPSIGEPLDLGARAMLQHAAWMNAYTAGSSGLGMVAALRHQIGAIYNVPHGVASAIIFPHCINFNRPRIDPYLALVAKSFDLVCKDTTDAAGIVINRVRELINETGVPTRLRDVGVPRDGLQTIVGASMEDPLIQTNLTPVSSKEQLIGVLEQAW